RELLRRQGAEASRLQAAGQPRGWPPADDRLHPNARAAAVQIPPRSRDHQREDPGHVVQAPVLEVSNVASPERRLRLLVLVSKAPGLAPGQRFRLEQWAPHCASRHGIDLEFLAFESPRLTELLHQPGRRAKKGAWVLWDFARRLGPVLGARRY